MLALLLATAAKGCDAATSLLHAKAVKGGLALLIPTSLASMVLAPNVIIGAVRSQTYVGTAKIVTQSLTADLTMRRSTPVRHPGHASPRGLTNCLHGVSTLWSSGCQRDEAAT